MSHGTKKGDENQSVCPMSVNYWIHVLIYILSGIKWCIRKKVCGYVQVERLWYCVRRPTVKGKIMEDKITEKDCPSKESSISLPFKLAN